MVQSILFKVNIHQHRRQVPTTGGFLLPTRPRAAQVGEQEHHQGVLFHGPTYQTRFGKRRPTDLSIVDTRSCVSLFLILDLSSKRSKIKCVGSAIKIRKCQHFLANIFFSIMSHKRTHCLVKGEYKSSTSIFALNDQWPLTTPTQKPEKANKTVHCKSFREDKV